MDGAPEGATGFVLWTGKIRYLNGETNEVYSVSSKEWNPANIMVLNLMIPLNDLRSAIADHEKCQHEWNETTSNGDVYRFFVCKHCDSTRNFIPLNEDITDYVSDIRNHIAPTTVVIDK